MAGSVPRRRDERHAREHRGAEYHRTDFPRRSRRLPQAGARPLDDPTAASPPPNPAPQPNPDRGADRKSAPGLRAQFASTREAAIALVRAHVDLAKAEIGEIAGEVKRVVALAALAVAVLLLAALLVVIGGTLFLAEWLLGSMGWGVLHGLLLAVGVAATAGLLAVGIPTRRVVRPLLAGLAVAVVVGVALGLELPNQLYRGIGDSVGLSAEPGIRPLVAGLLVGALVGVAVGIASATTIGGSGGSRVAAVIGFIVAGAAVGSFSAITFGQQAGAAVGITIGYLTWITLMGVDVARNGVDTEGLKERFYPTQTSETSKETLEWLQRRMPPGTGS